MDTNQHCLGVTNHNNLLDILNLDVNEFGRNEFQCVVSYETNIYALSVSALPCHVSVSMKQNL